MLGRRGGIYDGLAWQKSDGPIILNGSEPEPREGANHAQRLPQSGDSTASRSAGAIRTPREENRTSHAGRKASGRVGSRPDLPLRVYLLPHHQLPARILSRSAAFRPGGQPRSPLVRRGRVGCGGRAGRRGGRDGADGRGVGQAVLRLDEDDLPLAAARADQPPVRHGRPQARRLPAKLRRSVRRAKPGAGAARLAVQPTDPGRAGDDYRARAAACPRRRLAGRRGQTAVEKDRPQRGDHPLHAEAVRPRSSRGGDLPRQPRAAAIGLEAEDLPAVPARRAGRDAGQTLLPHQDEHLPDHRRDAGAADHGPAARTHSQRDVRAGAFAPPRRSDHRRRCRNRRRR